MTGAVECKREESILKYSCNYHIMRNIHSFLEMHQCLWGINELWQSLQCAAPALNSPSGSCVCCLMNTICTQTPLYLRSQNFDRPLVDWARVRASADLMKRCRCRWLSVAMVPLLRLAASFSPHRIHSRLLMRCPLTPLFVWMLYLCGE